MDQSSGQDILFLPEVTNCISVDRAHQFQVLEPYAGNSFIEAVRERARHLGLWVALGSVTVKTADDDGRFANRSVMINAEGEIVAFYDKIHMFDVTLENGETHKESANYQAGSAAVIAPLDGFQLGMSICYDVRFPTLYRRLAQAGADIICVPSAFTRPTGEAHWHILLRARAIETGCYVMAPAQVGAHENGRQTYGHSLIVDPWGKIIAQASAEDGFVLAHVDRAKIDAARRQIPSLGHGRSYTLPDSDTEAQD